MLLYSFFPVTGVSEKPWIQQLFIYKDVRSGWYNFGEEPKQTWRPFWVYSWHLWQLFTKKCLECNFWKHKQVSYQNVFQRKPNYSLKQQLRDLKIVVISINLRSNNCKYQSCTCLFALYLGYMSERPVWGFVNILCYLILSFQFSCWSKARCGHW